MAKKFNALREKMSPTAQARAASRAKKMLAEMPLQELRHAKELSQVKLAEALHVNQAAISKLERRTDMYISTLRSYIKAMGGDLEVIAKFPDGEVRISNFADHPDDIHSAATR
jgi:DNA-binding transcriptional regulator YiaG